MPRLSEVKLFSVGENITPFIVQVDVSLFVSFSDSHSVSPLLPISQSINHPSCRRGSEMKACVIKSSK